MYTISCFAGPRYKGNDCNYISHHFVSTIRCSVQEKHRNVKLGRAAGQYPASIYDVMWDILTTCMMTSSNGNIFRVTGHLCGEFPAQRPVTQSVDVFFDLRLNNRLSKQSRGWWFETISCPLWRHCDGLPELATDSTACPVRKLMKPMTEKITQPANTLVPQLIMATSRASLEDRHMYTS